MFEDNKIYNIDCLEGLKQLPEESVDLVVTSPPYDNIRTYGNLDEWSSVKFERIARELYRVLKPGCCVVWVVGDATVNGGESGTSFRQALFFKEVGFTLHDTMIYEKNSSSFPARRDGKRYTQIFEYMFVFCKGEIRKDVKLIADKRNKWSGWTSWGSQTQYNADGKLKKAKSIKPVPEYSVRTNIWKYNVGFNDKTSHPAVFPERLAEDHILTWSAEGDLVLDPFMGSGTTAKVAMLNNRRYLGFEINEEYWKESLERVAKHEDKPTRVHTHADVEGMDVIVSDSDAEDVKKAKLFEELNGQMKEYFDTMTYSILKNLRLQFASKANDRRVEQVLKEREFTEDGLTVPDTVL